MSGRLYCYKQQQHSLLPAQFVFKVELLSYRAINYFNRTLTR